MDYLGGGGGGGGGTKGMLAPLSNYWGGGAGPCPPPSSYAYVYVRCACVRHLPEFVRSITSTFMHGFQNNLAQLFSLRSSSAI